MGLLDLNRYGGGNLSDIIAADIEAMEFGRKLLEEGRERYEANVTVTLGDGRHKSIVVGEPVYRTVLVYGLDDSIGPFENLDDALAAIRAECDAKGWAIVEPTPEVHPLLLALCLVMGMLFSGFVLALIPHLVDLLN